MFLATAETLPQSYDILDIVYVSFIAVSPMKSTIAEHAEKLAEASFERARQQLARRAIHMGADAVIALRVRHSVGAAGVQVFWWAPQSR